MAILKYFQTRTAKKEIDYLVSSAFEVLGESANSYMTKALAIASDSDVPFSYVKTVFEKRALPYIGQKDTLESYLAFKECAFDILDSAILLEPVIQIMKTQKNN